MCEQKSLACLTAKTHGISEECDEENNLPVFEDAIYLKPPVPITQTETNWPLLTVSKVMHEHELVFTCFLTTSVLNYNCSCVLICIHLQGFFEGSIMSKGRTTFADADLDGADDAITVGADGWGDDTELVLVDDEGEGGHAGINVDSETKQGDHFVIKYLLFLIYFILKKFIRLKAINCKFYQTFVFIN